MGADVERGLKGARGIRREAVRIFLSSGRDEGMLFG